MNAQQLVDAFNARVMRERVLLMLAAGAVLAALWDTLWMQSMRRARHDLQMQLEAPVEDDSAATEQSDPRVVALRRAGELQQQSQALDAQIRESARHYVSAGRMTQLLRDVLERHGALRLVSVRKLPTQMLVPPADSSAVATAPFIHRIELVAEGRYADIETYLQQLEALPWKFHWDTLDVSTRDYPLIRMRLTISTLGMDPNWLDV
jgi:MSHA biogenesis protein MshJ